jgi:hypothetical protein
MTAQTRTARLLAEWLADAKQAEEAHSEAADHFGTFDSWVGGAAAVLAALIGTSVFATLEQPLSTPVRVLAALVTFAAAALSGLQTFIKPGARAEAHRQASRAYGALERQIEQAQADRPTSGAEAERELDTIRSGLDNAGKEAPNVPPRIWRRVQRRLTTQRPP